MASSTDAPQEDGLSRADLAAQDLIAGLERGDTLSPARRAQLLGLLQADSSDVPIAADGVRHAVTEAVKPLHPVLAGLENHLRAVWMMVGDSRRKQISDFDWAQALYGAPQSLVDQVMAPNNWSAVPDRRVQILELLSAHRVLRSPEATEAALEKIAAVFRELRQNKQIR